MILFGGPRREKREWKHPPRSAHVVFCAPCLVRTGCVSILPSLPARPFLFIPVSRAHPPTPRRTFPAYHTPSSGPLWRNQGGLLVSQASVAAGLTFSPATAKEDTHARAQRLCNVRTARGVRLRPRRAARGDRCAGKEVTWCGRGSQQCTPPPRLPRGPPSPSSRPEGARRCVGEGFVPSEGLRAFHGAWAAHLASSAVSLVRSATFWGWQ
jgi:hypothetical protein